MKQATLILNVEDNDAARHAKTRLLINAGFRVEEASDGAQALAMVAALQPALVLLDMKLPDISGWDVCRQIKANPLTAKGVCAADLRCTDQHGRQNARHEQRRRRLHFRAVRAEHLDCQGARDPGAASRLNFKPPTRWPPAQACAAAPASPSAFRGYANCSAGAPFDASAVPAALASMSPDRSI